MNVTLYFSGFIYLLLYSFLTINKLMVYKVNYMQASTGQPRYLKVQGNGENTSSYPKFDIAKM